MNPGPKALFNESATMGRIVDSNVAVRQKLAGLPCKGHIVLHFLLLCEVLGKAIIGVEISVPRHWQLSLAKKCSCQLDVPAKLASIYLDEASLNNPDYETFS
ncbi:hypothetical protein I7I51_04500 [Histoplasma capsulatum]|uniref:Uncharacterized protein n=1 Tax=Ajellomyces capsulatus TaxID=5037 RepID=A0A8A1MCT9_AJECA|nr:hypothetical protein I7I51_04500 [Histoplasma capsulatum]